MKRQNSISDQTYMEDSSATATKTSDPSSSPTMEIEVQLPSTKEADDHAPNHMEIEDLLPTLVETEDPTSTKTEMKDRPSTMETQTHTAGILKTSRSKSEDGTEDFYRTRWKTKNLWSTLTESVDARTELGVKEYFRDYCSSTAIHGVRYFAEDGRIRIEKIFWLMAITVSMMGYLHLIMKVYQKWDSSPVILSFAESSTSIWQVPFPAVSICPETKSCQTKFNFTQKYYVHVDSQQKNICDSDSTNSTDYLNSYLTDEELKKVDALSLLCDRHIHDRHSPQFLKSEGAAFIEDEIMQDLRKLTPDVEFAITLCVWQGQRVANCSELFKPVWSDEGICFTFNMLDNSELFTKSAVQNAQLNTGIDSTWTLEKGYHSNRVKAFPNRALNSGARGGLFIQLKANKSDFDYVCRGVQGFKVLLHNPAVVPLISQQYFRVPCSQDVVAVVKPTMMTTSAGLSDYDPHRRQCYFPSERHLRFFQVYTLKNCELECLANLTLRQCGCVSFFMPRNNRTAICGPGRRVCTQNTMANFINGGSRMDLKRKIYRETAGSPASECDCLDSCVSLEYNAEISQAHYNWENDVLNKYQRKDTDQAESGLILSRMSIFFKDFQFITIQRKELYGRVDFISKFGGLMNLCSGCSFISLIEIFYFLTLRLWSRLKKRRQERSAFEDVANLETLG